jgi:hypothetical protein
MGVSMQGSSPPLSLYALTELFLLPQETPPLLTLYDSAFAPIELWRVNAINEINYLEKIERVESIREKY